MGFFIRPKSSTKNNANGLHHVEPIGVVQSYEDEYMETSGVDPDDVNSGAIHRRDPKRREAAPGSPLPGGSWGRASSRAVSSGFGRGTRAGSTGRR
ncbi:MAG: hypothetical protein DRQ89_14260 [Epsilonproteobacteria bacterium]|nr:MAG: hypothetical protein DRQ89_14260 [Campylobacterota bacterium]